MKRNRERGAIVIEATISLTAFVFAILTLLLVVNIYYVQSKIGVALNSAAKELSEYCYLYFKLNLQEIDQSLSSDTDQSRADAKGTIDNLANLNNAISGVSSSAQSLDFEALKENINAGMDAGSAVYNDLSGKLADDPAGFITGMGMMAVDELAEEGKALLASAMGKAFMKKNLVASASDSADAFLKRYKVVDGLDGLDFNYTTFLPGGKSSYIQLVCSYDVQVIKLLNIDFKFHFRQAAMTNGWATGISKIHPDTNVSTASPAVWDLGSEYFKEQYILNEERKGYPYIATDQGFDAYDNGGGKNEFVKIEILPLPEDGGDANELGTQLEDIYKNLEQAVSGLDKEINVQDHSGKTHSIESDPESRSLSIVLVIPDNASDAAIKEAVDKFKQDHPDVNVEVKTGYGELGGEKDEGGDGGSEGDGG